VFISEDAADGQRNCLIIKPNRSLSWRQSIGFVAVTGIFLMVISAVFAAKGLWLIFPFAGLEIAAFAYATYVVMDVGYRCEVVSIDGDEVLVQKGRQRRGKSQRGGPESSASFPLGWARIEFVKSAGWYPGQLLISASGKTVELGEFLPEEEKAELADALEAMLAKR
jgi:uncharacterized membrane protein